MVKGLYVALGVAVFGAILLSLSGNVGLRSLRLVAILATYGLGIALLFADRFWRVVGIWCAAGVLTGLLYFAYDAWSLSRTAAQEPGEEVESASLGHVPMGLFAWPLMLPEVVEYWLADLGVLDGPGEGSDEPSEPAA